MHSVVMIIPEPRKADAETLAIKLGYAVQDGTFSVDLSSSGSEPATHFGAHAWASPGGQFYQLCLAVQAGVTPPGLESNADALKALYIRVVEDSSDAMGNWQATLAETGLQVIRPAASLIGE